jgi:small GTP-binding protein
MAIINQAAKELQIKIVYYGPGQGGKTTNLEQLHSHIENVREKGRLVSLATDADRTLFFDFFPMEAITIRGFQTKFQIYTVPGQVIYNETRKLVLRGVDGIIFVADSQCEKMPDNVESLQNLEENLRSLNLSFPEIPRVFQYNKRDLPDAAPVAYMNYLLNNREREMPAFPGIATRCEGVLESFNMITRLLLNKYLYEKNTPPA